MASGQWIEAGLLLRGNIRAELTKAGITFTETKSFGSSVFVIPDRGEYVRVVRALQAQGLG